MKGPAGNGHNFQYDTVQEDTSAALASLVPITMIPPAEHPTICLPDSPIKIIKLHSKKGKKKKIHF